MLLSAPRAAALALFLCVQAFAQTKTGQVTPIVPSAGGQLGAAPAVTLAPPALTPTLTLSPSLAALAAPTAAPVAAPLAAPAPVAARGVPAKPVVRDRHVGFTPQALRENLSVDGRIDESRVRQAYEGDSLLRGLPPALADDRALGEHVRDGAPAKALQRLAHLGKKHPDLKGKAGQTAVGLLERRLQASRPSPAVAEQESILASSGRFLSRREYGLALEATRRAAAALKAAPLSQMTRLELSRDIQRLITTIKDRGAPSLYGRQGEFTSAELAQRVRSLQSRDPGAYVGESLSEQPVRVQCYGDCAVQQAYNHPKLAALSEQLPYRSFLAAVEAANATKVRKEGMALMDSKLLLYKLGLNMVAHHLPADAEALAGLLRDHGALMATVSWHAPKGLSGGDHAVLIQGALREKGGWRFIVIDSNSTRPQLFDFRDLQLFSPGDLASVELLPLDSPYMPKVLRGITDPQERLRAGAHSFIERFAVLRPRVPGWKRMVYGALNAVRERFGREELEPTPVMERDENALPLDKIPKQAYGLKLPEEAILSGPDGRRYINRSVLERLIAKRRQG